MFMKITLLMHFLLEAVNYEGVTADALNTYEGRPVFNGTNDTVITAEYIQL